MQVSTPPIKTCNKHDTPSWDNRNSFHWYTLESLRVINSNSVVLSPTYPPFNNDRGFCATPGSIASGAKLQNRCSWNDNVHKHMSSYVCIFLMVIERLRGKKLKYKELIG